MLEEYLYSLLILFSIVYWLQYVIKTMNRCPPGPWGLPLLGYYPFLGSKPVKKLSKLADKYGELMTVNYFGDYYYYLNSFDIVKQVLVKQSNYSSDRPLQFNVNSPAAYVVKNSIITSSGENWKLQHSYTLSILSNLGIGKRKMDDIIFQISDKLVNYILNTNAKPTDFYEYLANFSSNVISSLLFRKHYDFDDPQYIRLRDDVRGYFLATSGIDGNLCGKMFDFFNHIKGDSCRKLNDVRRRAREYFLPIINERIEQRRNINQECNDLLDYFIENFIRSVENYNIDTVFDNCFMTFIGGTETTSMTLYHSINLLILHPDIQEKVQQEIDNLCGGNRYISYQDRHLLPYTQAVIQEVQRFVSLIPFGFVRSNSVPIKVVTKDGNYVIPKGSNIIPNLWQIARDSKHFKNPHNFDPNNFLNEKGEFVKNEANMPFSAGKRMCIGSALASKELFIGFVTLFQRFQWKSPTGKQVPRNVIETQAMILANFTCCAVPRD